MSTLDVALQPVVSPGFGLAGGAREEGPANPVGATSPRPRSRFRPISLIYFVLVLFLLLPALCVMGIASYFRLSSPSRALRGAVMEGVPGHWHSQFGINVGSLTVGLVRFGSIFLHLPTEAQVALAALDSGDVGVYQLAGPSAHRDYGAILRVADKTMRRRGWERIVGVAEGSEFVAVYASDDLWATDLSCCVAVLDDENLVVVTVRGNVLPLLELAQKRHDGRPLLEGVLSRIRTGPR